MTMTLSLEFILCLLSYDPGTGEFVWLKRVSRGTKSGFIAGHICKTNGYRTIRIKGKDYRANKLAIFMTTGIWPDGIVDHVNGVKSDDRIGNLRKASHTENMRNSKTRTDSVSGLKGACLDKRSGKYVSSITVNRKRIYLGRFDNAEDAHMAYCENARKHFGEFARFE